AADLRAGPDRPGRRRLARPVRVAGASVRPAATALRAAVRPAPRSQARLTPWSPRHVSERLDQLVDLRACVLLREGKQQAGFEALDALEERHPSPHPPIHE